MTRKIYIEQILKNEFHWQGLKKITIFQSKNICGCQRWNSFLFPVLIWCVEKSQRRGAVWPDHVPSGHHRERLLWAALHGLCTSAGKTAAALRIIFFYHLKFHFTVFPPQYKAISSTPYLRFQAKPYSHRRKSLSWGCSLSVTKLKGLVLGPLSPLPESDHAME